MGNTKTLTSFVNALNPTKHALKSNPTPLGEIGYDNFRDNIDPKVATLEHIKTTVAQDGTGTFNGTTSAVIQQAINSLSTTGGTVLIKKGTYLLSTTLTMYSNISLIGEGNSTIIKLAPGAYATNFKMLNPESVNNFKISNFAIDGNSSNATGTNVHAIYMTNCDNVTIEKMYIHDVISIAIFIKSSTHVFINNNYCYNMQGNTGILLGYGSSYSTISNNIIDTVGSPFGNGIFISNDDASTNSHITITGNICKNYYDVGIEIGGQGGLNKYCTVTGNICQEGQEVGIFLRRTSDTVVNGNYVKDITGANAVGIQLYGENGTKENNIVTNNIINNVTLSLIKSREQSGMIVSDNICISGMMGININSTSYAIISNNLASNVVSGMRWGVSVDYINFNGNIIKSFTGVGTDGNFGTNSISNMNLIEGINNMATNTFTTVDGKTVTVRNGVVISIV